MKTFNTAAFAGALDRVLRSDVATEHLVPHIPPHLSVDTVINRAVLALLNEFSSLALLDQGDDLRPAAVAPAHQPPQATVGAPAAQPVEHVDLETGEITDGSDDASSADETGSYDGPEHDGPIINRPDEMADDEEGSDVKDLGEDEILKLINWSTRVFSAPDDQWRTFVGSYADERIPDEIRRSPKNAAIIACAKRYYPDLSERLEAILDRGRVAP